MKLALGFGLLLTMLVAMGGLTFYTGHKVKLATEAANGDQQKERHTILIDVALMKQIQAANEYVFNGDESSLKKYGEAKQNVEQKLAAIKKMTGVAKAQEIVSRFEASARQVTDLTEQEITFRQASRNYEATDMAFSPKEQQAIQQVEEVAGEMEAWEEKQTEGSMKAEHSTETRAKLATLGLVLGGLLMGAAAAFLIAGSIARSLAQMSVLAQEIAGKNLNVADLKISTQDEIGKTQAGLNSMKQSLREIVHSIATDAGRVTSASQQVSTQAQEIMANSAETSAQANLVSSAAHQVTQNLETVVAGAGEMTAATQSIASNAQQSSAAVTEAVEHARAASATVNKLGESSAEIDTVIKVITTIAQQTNLLAINATTEAARADEAGKGFAVVAIEVKELAKATALAIADASRKIEGVITAFQADTESAAEIRQVIKVIGSIAQQTNLLALNARIEAARAGEAGTKFAVVAHEVKELAAQTGTAAEDISRKIEALQGDTKAAIKAIASIGEVVNRVNTLSSTIGSAVQGQAGTMVEMSRNLAEAAASAGEISKNIGDVAQAAQGTTTNASEAQKAAKQLEAISADLNILVAQFKIDGSDSAPSTAAKTGKSMAAAAGV